MRKLRCVTIVLCAALMTILDVFLDSLITDEYGNPVHWPAFAVLCLGIFIIATLCFTSVHSEEKVVGKYESALEHMKTMTDNVPGAIFQWYMGKDTSKTGFRYISQRAEELFGINIEAVTEDWKKLHIHPGDIYRWANSLKRCSQSLEEWIFEGRFIQTDDEVKWVRCIAKPVRIDEEQVIFNGIMLDITGEKDAEREIKEIRKNSEKLGAEILLVNQSLNETNERLQQINKQKNEILGIAAHDLKNPLSGVVGFAESIRENLESGSEIGSAKAEIVDMTESIEYSARHMLSIINGLLDASSLEDGSVELIISDCDLGRLMEAVIIMNEGHAEKKFIKMHSVIEPRCVVYGDDQRLKELVDNILSNAIKYSTAHKNVWIRVFHKTPESIQISIRDEGPGLTDEDKKKLFGKFQKLSARPTGGESSTGLGLAIAKSITELHNGKIWAESEYGKGSTFHIELPVGSPSKSSI